MHLGLKANDPIVFDGSHFQQTHIQIPFNLKKNLYISTNFKHSHICVTNSSVII